MFDSSLITEEQAKEEVIKHFNGKKIEFPRVLKFEPGYYSNPWKHNVISIGLSSSFFEPLEATSIWMTIMQLETILTRPELIENSSEKARDFYNNRFVELQEDIAAFIYFHYMSGTKARNEFWEKYDEESAPPRMKYLLEVLDYKLFDSTDVVFDGVSLDSWFYVAYGTRNKKFMKRLEEATKANVYSLMNDINFEQFKQLQSRIVSRALVDHRFLLEDLGGTPWAELSG